MQRDGRARPAPDQRRGGRHRARARRRDDRGLRRRRLRRAQRARLRAEGDRDRRADAGADPARSPTARTRSATSESGAVTVQNPCLSGGAIEVFLEPVLRAPRLLVEGDTPIARALRALGAQMDLSVVAIAGEDFELRADDLAIVAAGHGRDELGALRRGLEAGVPYVGLVASRRRGDGVMAELRGDGVAGRAAGADRHARGAGPRRPHAGRDRGLDPRPDRRGAPAPRCRRSRSPPSTPSAG